MILTKEATRELPPHLPEPRFWIVSELPTIRPERSRCADISLANAKKHFPLSFSPSFVRLSSRRGIPRAIVIPEAQPKHERDTKMSNKLHHATIKLQDSYPAPPERVFSEFTDPVARARWSAPSQDALIYDEADFRLGGKDVFRCGPKADPKFRGETRYLNIVTNAHVVSSETLDVEGQRLAVALTTLDFESTEAGTNLTVTIQIVSFVGPDIIHGYESGNKSALKNLSLHLSDMSSR